jgi:serine/threonine protein kinase
MKPQKIDLHLVAKYEASGGDPEIIIKQTNNSVNQYLVSDNNNYIFVFDNTFNTKILNGSRYLGKGLSTAVFALKKLKSPNDSIPIDNLILRMIDPQNDLDRYLEKWEEDISILPNNIPKIYLYGLIFKGKMIIAKYTLVKKYGDESKINQLNFNNKKKFLQKLLEALKILQLKNYTYRDLKIENIGYEPDDKGDVNQFIVLDYDDTTILDTNGPFFNGGCPWSCAAPYPPYYIIIDYNEKKSDYRSRLDKLPVFGLATIIIQLFYGPKAMNIIYAKHITPVRQKYGHPYKSFPKLYEEKSRFDALITGINDLIPFQGLKDDKDDKFIKENLIIPLLSHNYEDIPTFSQLLESYNSHFGL